jgi:hypothetical protein
MTFRKSKARLDATVPSQRLRVSAVNAILLTLASLWGATASAQLPQVYCDIGASVLHTSGAPLAGGASGDFNGDNAADLALLDTGDIAIELINPDLLAQGMCNQAITPSPAVTVANPIGVAVAPIDRTDRLNDLAVVAQSSNILLFSGSTNGTFMPSGTPSAGLVNPRTIAVANLTNDGFPDLIVGDGSSIILLLGSANPYTVSNRLQLGTEQVVAVRVADFNGDSQLDIATVDLLGQVRIFLQTQPGAFATPPVQFAVGQASGGIGFPTDMQVVDPINANVFTPDFNHDSIPDLAFVTTDGTNGQLHVFLGARSGGTVSFPTHKTFPAGSSPSGLGLTDLDNDGNLDVVVADSAAPGSVLFFLGDGTGNLRQSGAARPTGPGPSAVVLADVDGDTRNDVITTNSDGSITIFLTSNPPATPTATNTYTPTVTGTPGNTGTETPTVTATPTASVTVTQTPLPTQTQTATFTGTVAPTVGGFLVMGQGCANVGGTNGPSDAAPLIVLAGLAVLRRYLSPRRRRADS